MRTENSSADAYSEPQPSMPSERWLIEMHTGPSARPARHTYSFLKRCADILLSSLALLLLSPLFVIIPVLIKLDSPGPGYYTQQRIGKNGRPFYIYKFRSMCSQADSLLNKLTSGQLSEYESNYKLKNDFRVTRIGRFLRKTNLDELPQLLNIFAGQLSFIGPRPVVLKETEKYGADRAQFLSVTPGLTGYWQVHRRPDTTYEQRMKMELYYIDNRTLAMDALLMVQTVVVLFCGTRRSTRTHADVPNRRSLCGKGGEVQEGN